MSNQVCRVQGHCHSPSKTCLTLSWKLTKKLTSTTSRLKSDDFNRLTKRPFKTCYYSHTHLFQTKSCANDTERSKYVWNLQDNKQQDQTKWDIVHLAAPYKCDTRRCDVCLTEKMVIATSNQRPAIGKRRGQKSYLHAATLSSSDQGLSPNASSVSFGHAEHCFLTVWTPKSLCQNLLKKTFLRR